MKILLALMVLAALVLLATPADARPRHTPRPEGMTGGALWDQAHCKPIPFKRHALRPRCIVIRAGR